MLGNEKITDIHFNFSAEEVTEILRMFDHYFNEYPSTGRKEENLWKLYLKIIHAKAINNYTY